MRATSCLAALCVAMAAVHATARAQTAAVAGQVTIVERPGAGRSDPRTAVIYLESRRPVAWPAPAAAALASASIAMRGREFVPHVRVVRTGGSVAFPNQDPFSHNVFSNTGAGAFDLGLYRRGTTRSTTFDQPGVYPIYCNIHARMVSFVIVTPTPHVARAGADGRFVLPDVPAGRYQMRVWHERATDLALDLEVPPTGLSGVRVVLDARQFVPAPHLNKFGLPYTAIRTDRY